MINKLNALYRSTTQNHSSKILFMLIMMVLTLSISNSKAQESPATATFPAGSKYKMNLSDAKKLALQQSPTLAQAKSRIDAAAAAMEETKSAYWPTLDLGFGITRYEDRATRPQRGFDDTTRYNLGLSSNWLVFDGFQRRFTTLISQHDHASALSSHLDAQRLLLQAVSASFYSALLAQDSMGIAREDAEFNRVVLADARKRQEGGIATVSEVLNFQLQVAKAEVSYIAAERAWRAAIVALGELLAITQDDIWQSIELLPPAEELLQQQVELSELLSYARQHRPDLQSAQNKILAASASVDLARANFYPKVQLFAEYGFERYDSLRYNKHYDRNILFGVSASWNLFEGFRTDSQISRSLANLQAALQSRQELELAIDSEIRRNHLALISSRQQFSLQENILSAAREIRDLVHKEYLGGTTTITRLNEVQTDVTISAAARSQAYIQVFLSLEQLAASTGKNLLLDEQQ